MGATRRVLATEVSKVAVAAATDNMKANGIDNVSVARMSASDFTQYFQGERSFHRLDGTKPALHHY